MCGIAGYVGYRNASDVLIDCLKRLEYRGYDSAGIAVANKKLSIFKATGEIDSLRENMPKISHFNFVFSRNYCTSASVLRE